ncbi:PREDICTED: uncharacterized protein LOC104805885 isoform X1 [Tarenaya hassleriana]|uniref:uncharacterized protein LOC104805885 isoform X1 n=1 Tax=Tarenaya hassleriana TaxID=28532 RepID=UPI00053C2F42|nr:PREDICTED: uncharacterized protein LOC104805885 isoform X1 [Tarenaya hassleriana]
MASIMSPSVVFGPLRSSRGFFFKEGRQREVALGRLSIRKTCYRVMCFHNLYCSSKGKFPAGHGCHNDLVGPLNMSARIIPCHLVGSSCTQTTITGYWVGPDLDDGWGFVDALVVRST